MQASEEPGHSHRDDGQAHAIACPPQRDAARSGEGGKKTELCRHERAISPSARLARTVFPLPDLSARTARGETAAMAVPEYRTAKF